MINIDLSDGLAWFGFWIFAAVFIAGDCWLYEKGHDTVFQTHKTDSEKELLRLRIEERKLSIEIMRRKSLNWE